METYYLNFRDKILGSLITISSNNWVCSKIIRRLSHLKSKCERPFGSYFTGVSRFTTGVPAQCSRTAISGSKSILVSNWYVETYSAQELVVNLFKNIKDYPELSLSENFKTTMIEQMKKDKVKSHPLFWAPFVIVGKDSKMSF